MGRSVICAVGAASLIVGLGGCDEQEFKDPVECHSEALPEESLYILPFEAGDEHRASKTIEHIPHHKFAVDFGMSIGTPLVAARAGEVIRVEESFPNDNNVSGEENRVDIQHEDGTVGRYIHLDQDGVVVELGEWVEQGQLIGFSGNSGNSSGPHLHFDVALCPSRGALDLCSITVPVNFANAYPRDCQLITNEWYAAH